MSDDMVDRLMVDTTNGLVCPNIRHLDCSLTEVLPRLIHHFLPLHLTHLNLYLEQLPAHLSADSPPDPGSTLQALPTSYLQELTIDFNLEAVDCFRDRVSAMVQRCGDSLRILDIPMSLTEAAVNHILRLKNLRVWLRVHSSPPTASQFPTTLPPLRDLTISTREAYRLMAWFARGGRRTPDAPNSPLEHAGLQATLTDVYFEFKVTIDAAFISPFSHFPNLTVLEVESYCDFDCTFSLKNRDVMELSAALPLLERLCFGLPCSNSSHDTTVSRLLALSAHCKNLLSLWIHFNTTSLVDDIRFLSEDPELRALRGLPTRCPLEFFGAGGLPFPNVTDRDVTTIAEGFMDIFPSISSVKPTMVTGWRTLDSRIHQLRAMKTGSIVEQEHVSDR